MYNCEGRTLSLSLSLSLERMMLTDNTTQLSLFSPNRMIMMMMMMMMSILCGLKIGVRNRETTIESTSRDARKKRKKELGSSFSRYSSYHYKPITKLTSSFMETFSTRRASDFVFSCTYYWSDQTVPVTTEHVPSCIFR